MSFENADFGPGDIFVLFYKSQKTPVPSTFGVWSAVMFYVKFYKSHGPHALPTANLKGCLTHRETPNTTTIDLLLEANVSRNAKLFHSLSYDTTTSGRDIDFAKRVNVRCTTLFLENLS